MKSRLLFGYRKKHLLLIWHSMTSLAFQEGKESVGMASACDIIVINYTRAITHSCNIDVGDFYLC